MEIVKVILIGVIILLLIILLSRQEFFYLDQIAMKSYDPTLYKYTGRDKDILGISHKGYYLENRNYANSRVAPQRLDGVSPYFNHTDYLDLPVKYRPRPLLLYVKNAM